jgi:hypothetical protein
LLGECATSHTRMSHFAYDSLKGRQVQFLVDDIHLPEPAVVLRQLHAGEVLSGTVVDLSDGGIDGRVFVVIEVQGLQNPCVLAAERILRTS